MSYTIYDSTTGKITSVVTASLPQVANLNIANTTYIDGAFDGTKYYINNGVPTLLPVNPSTSLMKYKFDWTDKTWNLDSTATTLAVRSRRNMFLSATVDKVNPVWFASLTQEQQTELQTYRTALLNVPQQSGFPTTITWPTKPSWL